MSHCVVMSRRWRLGGWFTATGLAFLVMSRAAPEWSGDLAPSPLWLATAAATAFVLACPARDRGAAIAGLVVGAVVTAVTVSGDSLRSALSPIAANTIEVLAVVFLTIALLPAGPSIRRTRDALLFLAVAATASALSATIAIADTSSQVIDERWESWWRWALGDLIGQMLVVPIVLTWGAHLITAPTGRRMTELVLTLSGLVGLTVVAMIVDIPLLFTAVPVVMWLSIRFGPRLTAPIALIIAVGVTAASGRGVGPFGDAEGDAVAQAQLFNLAIALSSLIGGAHALRAWRDHLRLAGVLAALPDVVLVRDLDGRIVDSWIPSRHRDATIAMAPGVSSAPPIIDDEPPPVDGPTLVDAPTGTVFERRAATVRGRRTVEFYRDVTSEQQTLKDLRRSEEAFDDARTAEQARIAKAIHDSPLQLLAAAKMRLEAAAADVAEVGDDELVTSAIDLIGQAAVELRGQVTELMPADVEAGEVVPALEQLARRMLEPGISVCATQHVGHIDGRVAATLFQIGREAIANVAKHAHARRVVIDLSGADGETVLKIVDDGVGAAAPAAGPGHIGVALMRERAESIGGHLTLGQRDGAGTELTVRVPATVTETA